jgi:hypothetical protein
LPNGSSAGFGEEVGGGFDEGERNKDDAIRNRVVLTRRQFHDATARRHPDRIARLDAEPPGGAENGLTLADVDLAVVDRESLGGGLVAAIGDTLHRRLVGDMHAALVLGRAAGAFFIVPVTGRLLFVAIVHRADLGLPMSQRLGQFIGKIF